MQLHKTALYMRSEGLHTRQCLGLRIHLAHLTKSSLELQHASVQQSFFPHGAVCITSFSMCFKRAGNPPESEAKVDNTFSPHKICFLDNSFSSNFRSHKPVATWNHSFSLIQVNHNFSKVAQAMQDPIFKPIYRLLSLHEHMSNTCTIACKVHLTVQQRTCLLHT